MMFARRHHPRAESQGCPPHLKSWIRVPGEGTPPIMHDGRCRVAKAVFLHMNLDTLSKHIPVLMPIQF